MDNLNAARARGIKRAFAGKGPIAFVAVLHDLESADGKTRAALGVAVANEPGYSPIPQFYFCADKMADAEKKANTLNAETLELDPGLSAAIVISTMGGRPFSPGN